MMLEKKLEQMSRDHFSLYNKLKKWAGSLWGNNVVYEQIKHDTGHSDKMLHYAESLLQNKFETDFLNVEELFLLLSAVYLHDIGMQTGWKSFLKIKGTVGHLTNEERGKITHKPQAL